MGKTQSRIGVGVWCFLSNSEWSRSAFFVNLLKSSLVSNFKIETKNYACVNCDLDVTTLVSESLKSSESEYSMRKIFGVEVAFVGIGVESELERRDSAHFWCKLKQPRSEKTCAMHEQLWFWSQHLKGQSKIIGKEWQYDSQSTVKQAVPLAKRSPLPIWILNSKLEIIS